MKVFESNYKNVEAVKLETEKAVFTYLPKYGCRLVSIKELETGREYLAQDDNDVFIPQTPDGGYVDANVSGFDDMFPTIDPMNDETGDKRRGVLLPCHGEVCRYPHKYKFDDSGLYTEFKSPTLGFTFKKEITAGKDGGLNVKYFITNEMDEDFNCLFAAHFMIAAEPDGYGLLPFGEGAPTEIMFDEHAEFGKHGDKIPLTKAMTVSSKYGKDENAFKYYFTEPVSEGYCGYCIPSAKRQLKISFDKDKIKYLGVWVNNGIFKGMYNYAVEPCTTLFDNPHNANERGLKYIIPANTTEELSLSINILRI